MRVIYRAATHGECSITAFVFVGGAQRSGVFWRSAAEREAVGRGSVENAPFYAALQLKSGCSCEQTRSHLGCMNGAALPGDLYGTK